MMKTILFLCAFIFAECAWSQIPIPPKKEDMMYDMPVEMSSMSPKERASRLSITQKDGKWAIKKGDSLVSDYIYDKIQFASKGLILTKDAKYGYITQDLNLVLPIKYDSIFSTYYNVLQVKKKDKYGIYDFDGKKIMPIKFNQITRCNKVKQCIIKREDGLADLFMNGKKVKGNPFEQVYFLNNGFYGKSDGKFGLFTKDFTSGFVYDSIATGRYGTKSKNQGRTGNHKVSHIKFGTDSSFFIVEKEGKVGLINEAGKLMIPIENEMISHEVTRKYITYKKGDKQGIYLLKCDKLFPAEFDRIHMDGTTFLEVNKGRKQGLINDATGEWVLPIAYDDIYKTRDYFILKQNGKKGFSDYEGNIIMSPKYDDIDNMHGYFSNAYKGLFKVKLGEMYGVISTEGKTIIPVENEHIFDFEDTFIYAIKNEKAGLYDLEGNVVQPTEWDYFQRPKTDRNQVYFGKKNNLWYILDTNGQLKFDFGIQKIFTLPNPTFDITKLSRREQTYYQAIKDENNRCGLLDVFSGNIALPLDYDGVFQYTTNPKRDKKFFLVKKQNKFGIVNQQNQIQVPFEYDSLSLYLTYPHQVSSTNNRYAHGLAAKKKGKWGVIDTYGKTLVPFTYDEIEKIGVYGLYKAKIKGKYVLINDSNKVLNEGPFTDIGNFEYFSNSNKYWALAFYDGKMKEINENGEFYDLEFTMKPHKGFKSFQALKDGLKEVMNSKDDALMKAFAKKIAPSDALIHWIKYAENPVAENYNYLNYDQMIDAYTDILLRFKYSYWNSEYFDQNTLEVEDYTVQENGIVTNDRISDWAYDDTKYLEKILRNAIKINGYWISSYYFRLNR